MSNNNLWQPKSYNSTGKFVTEYGNEVVELLNPQEGENILDLGCGTGELTNEIKSKGVKVTGVDVSENMLIKAKQNYHDIEFKQMDAQQSLDFEKESFDAVFSNAALHWMTNPLAVIKNINNILKKNGRFVFEMGGKGNIKEVLSSLDTTAMKYNIKDYDINNFYPSISEYSSLLEENGFTVKYMILFERPTLLDGKDGFKNWVKTFRVNLLDKIDDVDKFLNEAESLAYKSLFKDNNWYADYVRLRGVAVKN
ncbi:class I SAM-dependent methyltransferase [Francisella sp. LA112445]|uniref:class I SAM-dependent methyltransferase n=1 Tax=Francisella sp. LA112445 TaxID=1395624 RepID=UPI001788A689|nr:class I SAM-dependent methyltransferase [Francisella sp. LA112445]QIW10463.1 class I SAM-dependent methyltransferase [Francisella sp. LA112445]